MIFITFTSVLDINITCFCVGISKPKLSHIILSSRSAPLRHHRIIKTARHNGRYCPDKATVPWSKMYHENAWTLDFSGRHWWCTWTQHSPVEPPKNTSRYKYSLLSGKKYNTDNSFDRNFFYIFALRKVILTEIVSEKHSSYSSISLTHQPPSTQFESFWPLLWRSRQAHDVSIR